MQPKSPITRYRGYRVETTVRMGFPMGVPNGNPVGMRNKTPTWEWEWDGVLMNVDGYGNDSYSHGKNSRGFFTTGGNLCSTALFHHIRQRKCTNVKSGHFRLIERLAGRPGHRGWHTETQCGRRRRLGRRGVSFVARLIRLSQRAPGLWRGGWSVGRRGWPPRPVIEVRSTWSRLDAHLSPAAASSHAAERWRNWGFWGLSSAPGDTQGLKVQVSAVASRPARQNRAVDRAWWLLW